MAYFFHLNFLAFCTIEMGPLRLSMTNNFQSISSRSNLLTLDTFFRQIKSFLRFHLAFVFGLQTYYLIDFSKIYGLKGLEPKNKG